MRDVLLATGVACVVASRFSRKRRDDIVEHAVCVLDERASSGVRGTVEMRSDGATTVFKCALSGLRPGKHGFHVHRSGDLRGGCASTCDHYNPDGRRHGGARGRRRHRGDLGNIVASETGECDDVVIADVRLDEIIGRAIVVHEDEDDLGVHDDDPESLKTGNAGKRVGCGVIGRA